MLSRDDILRHGRELSVRCLSSMGVPPLVFIEGDLDDLSQDDVMGMLSDKKSPTMAMFGDWRGSKHDVYDIIMRFAENNFKRMRHSKYPVGTYVVVVSDFLASDQSSG